MRRLGMAHHLILVLEAHSTHGTFHLSSLHKLNSGCAVLRNVKAALLYQLNLPWETRWGAMTSVSALNYPRRMRARTVAQADRGAITPAEGTV
jgi:hypothetical protein